MYFSIGNDKALYENAGAVSLEKWYYGISLRPDYAVYKGKRFRIGFFKLKPRVSNIRGVQTFEKDYKGFMFTFAFLFDFYLRAKIYK